eukprot:sb/3461700/
MKVKVLNRNPNDYLKTRSGDLPKLPRNVDPTLHPHASQREYTQALNAVKLERVFAKPFVGSLDGHRDGVYSMLTHPKRLPILISGACDGEIKIWNVTTKECLSTLAAHSGFVRGMGINEPGDCLISVGDDQMVKLWSVDEAMNKGSIQPKHTIVSKTMLTGIDYQWGSSSDTFATCGTSVGIWSVNRNEPLRTFDWGVDTISSVTYNKVETYMLASTASDRNIVLYDCRENQPLRKVILSQKTNQVAFNPMEAFNFTAACDDNNLYTFDMRKLKTPLNVHMGHAMAVLSVNYSPTGREFVSGSYDKTVRIFPVGKGRSKEVYHTKRMQRVFCTHYSADSKFILTGSDETNIRLWKSLAWGQMGPVSARERAAFDYNKKLIDRYSEHPQVKRIKRHRNLPKMVKSISKEHMNIRSAAKKKEDNRRRHAKAGTVPRVAERAKHVTTTNPYVLLSSHVMWLFLLDLIGTDLHNMPRDEQEDEFWAQRREKRIRIAEKGVPDIWESSPSESDEDIKKQVKKEKAERKASQKTNQVAFNPMEAFNFTAACDDNNLYTFDMRKLKTPLNVHMGHAMAVLSVNYSPTGREFVSGSYDKTVRIFPVGKGRSKEVYHTKRMQRVFCTHYSADSKFILTGSDETNIRLWKSLAWGQMGPVSARERAAFDYNKKLIDRYSEHPQVKRIKRHRNLPKMVKSISKEHMNIRSAAKKKEDNRRRHAKAGTVPRVAERAKHVTTTNPYVLLSSHVMWLFLLDLIGTDLHNMPRDEQEDEFWAQRREKRIRIAEKGVPDIWESSPSESDEDIKKQVKKEKAERKAERKRKKAKKKKNKDRKKSGESSKAPIRPAAQSSDEEFGPPAPEIEEEERMDYGGQLLPGEGDAMAEYVKAGKRIPRRGEIGLTSGEIEKYEASGFVMSGSRHRRMEAVRLRKENQVYSADERRALALLTKEERTKKETEMISVFREMVSSKKK